MLPPVEVNYLGFLPGQEGRNIFKGKNQHKSRKEIMVNLTPSEMLIGHPPSTIEASGDEHDKEIVDVTNREE